MNYKVHIKPSGNTLTVKPDETVLAAALRQNYQFPHNCRNAICGACKGKLLDGKVDYGDKPIYALTEQEREEGLALFCSAKPLSDLVIHMDEVAGPQHITVQTLTCSVIFYKQLAPTVWQVLLKPEEAKPVYRAGQYLEILHRDGSPKPFSIANAPNADGIIELHIRHTPENTYTAELLDEIKQGRALRIKLPYGDCIYPKEKDVKTILLAGGTGFAPMQAILEQALSNELNPPIYFYWGARSLQDLYLHEKVLAWAQQYHQLHYIPVLSMPEPADNWQGKTGFVHEAVVAEHPELSHYQVYASG
ncbi:MAG: CDP-6-deoxy-delta-3,4-glucoseen reductase, partial [Gammaproteobacteria bacterium]|nr:CDP-6-deoxy-delta-3,4-glucoseen reductase [Gammaproteobacteria bacterium]